MRLIDSIISVIRTDAKPLIVVKVCGTPFIKKQMSASIGSKQKRTTWDFDSPVGRWNDRRQRISILLGSSGACCPSILQCDLREIRCGLFTLLLTKRMARVNTGSVDAVPTIKSRGPFFHIFHTSKTLSHLKRFWMKRRVLYPKFAQWNTGFVLTVEFFC